MPRYHVTLTDTEIQELKSLIQKGGKGYRIKHAYITDSTVCNVMKKTKLNRGL